MDDSDDLAGELADAVIELGNRAADRESDGDPRDIADGLLAGAIQFWLWAHQPCGDPSCEACEDLSTAAERMAELRRRTAEHAQSSDYYVSTTDSDVGHA